MGFILEEWFSARDSLVMVAQGVLLNTIPPKMSKMLRLRIPALGFVKNPLEQVIFRLVRSWIRTSGHLAGLTILAALVLHSGAVSEYVCVNVSLVACVLSLVCFTPNSCSPCDLFHNCVTAPIDVCKGMTTTMFT